MKQFDCLKNYISIACNEMDCTVCSLAKQTRFSFSASNSSSVKKKNLLHMDVWGPYKCDTYDNK